VAISDIRRLPDFFKQLSVSYDKSGVADQYAEQFKFDSRQIDLPFIDENSALG
jgi:hypothetical protein